MPGWQPEAWQDGGHRRVVERVVAVGAGWQVAQRLSPAAMAAVTSGSVDSWQPSQPSAVWIGTQVGAGVAAEPWQVTGDRRCRGAAARAGRMAGDAALSPAAIASITCGSVDAWQPVQPMRCGSACRLVAGAWQPEPWQRRGRPSCRAAAGPCGAGWQATQVVLPAAIASITSWFGRLVAAGAADGVVDRHAGWWPGRDSLSPGTIAGTVVACSGGPCGAGWQATQAVLPAAIASITSWFGRARGSPRSRWRCGSAAGWCRGVAAGALARRRHRGGVQRGVRRRVTGVAVLVLRGDRVDHERIGRAVAALAARGQVDRHEVGPVVASGALARDGRRRLVLHDVAATRRMAGVTRAVAGRDRARPRAGRCSRGRCCR